MRVYTYMYMFVCIYMCITMYEIQWVVAHPAGTNIFTQIYI